jgi:hypothetical protein
MAEILGEYIKQPAEVLDYDVDFADWLEGRDDEPAAHEVIVPVGLTKVSDGRTGTVVRVVLSGGADKTRHKITVRLTTSGGLVKEADFIVRVREI